LRYGGEEFAVLMAETDEAGGVAVAELIHDNVAALGIEHAGSAHGRVTVSIGAAAGVPACENRWDKLVRAADRALYDAKIAGRNMTQPAGQPAMPEPATPSQAARDNAPATDP
jgi:diguanylate cyclase (GGDEF)-like protein